MIGNFALKTDHREYLIDTGSSSGFLPLHELIQLLFLTKSKHPNPLLSLGFVHKKTV